MIKFSVKMRLMVCAVGLMSLSACQTASIAPGEHDYSKIDAAIDQAAQSAAANGQTEEQLALLEKVYKRNSADPYAAYKYAAALRHADYLTRASMVLSPFAMKDKAPTEVYAEYAAIQLELGEYDKAEKFSQQAVLADDKNYKGYHYLGLALEAKGKHVEAERAFRKALDYWQGDPTTVMNNLALNLTAQGNVDEALEILQKAQQLAPDRPEIERNIRIIEAIKVKQ